MFYIGPHAPALSPDDVQLVHRLWLNMRRDPTVLDLHHSDIITYALTRLAGQYAREKQEVLRDLRNYKSADSSMVPARVTSPDAASANQNSRSPESPERAHTSH